MIKISRKPGMATTEVVIGVALAAVVVFVAIGMFNDNLSDMAGNSNIGNTFNNGGSGTGNGDAKTSNAKYNRNYANSEVNVEIMGEQGLEMLRKKANNKAIELIDEKFNSTNQYSPEITYLSIALKALSGENHICNYMKKDSDDNCDNIGGYSYKLDPAGNDLKMDKISKDQGSIAGTVNLTKSSAINSIVNKYQVPTNGRKSAFTEDQKYNFISNLSFEFSPYIKRKDILLIRSTAIVDLNTVRNFSTNRATGTNPRVDTRKVSNELTTNLNGFIYNKLLPSLLSAYNQCDGSKFYTLTENCSGYKTISNSDYEYARSWASSLNARLANATTDEETMNIINAALADRKLVKIIENDSVNGTSDIFNDYVNGLKTKYSGIAAKKTSANGPDGLIGNIVAGVTTAKVAVVKTVTATVKVVKAVAKEVTKTVVKTASKVAKSVKNFLKKLF